MLYFQELSWPSIRPETLLGSNRTWTRETYNMHVVDQRVSQFKASLGSDLRVIVTELRDGEFIFPGFVDTDRSSLLGFQIQNSDLIVSL